MILKCIDHYCMNSINLKLQVPNLVTYLQVENKGIQDKCCASKQLFSISNFTNDWIGSNFVVIHIIF
jgi:hypothetical protein